MYDENDEEQKRLDFLNVLRRGTLGRPSGNIKDKISTRFYEILYSQKESYGDTVILTGDGEGARVKIVDGMIHIISAHGLFKGITIHNDEMINDFYVGMIPDGYTGHIIIGDANQQQKLEKIMANQKRGINASFILENEYMSASIKNPTFTQKIIRESLCSGSEILEQVYIEDSVGKIENGAFSNCHKLKKVIMNGHEKKGVTEIGDNAFEGCEELIEIILPETLTKIGKSAFKGCLKLKKIQIPNGIQVIDVSVFENCPELETVIIPESVRVIGDSAFKGCKKIKILRAGDEIEQVTHIPENVEKIGISAFEGCESITRLAIPEIKGEIPNLNRTFKDCTGLETIEIADGCRSIGEDMFKGCTSLKSICLPDSIQSIGSSAFEGCTDLRYLSYGEIEKSKLKWIAEDAFKDCVKLQGMSENEDTLVLGPMLEYIGAGAFKNCFALHGVKAEGNKLTSICGGAFKNCESLEFFEMQKKGLIFTTNGATGVWFGSRSFQGCRNLKHVTFSEKTYSIGDACFSGCESLETLELPRDLLRIHELAFLNCKRLTDIVLPEGVKEIGYGAFGRCESLDRIVIPKTVKKMEDKVFAKCTGLKNVILEKRTPGIENAFTSGSSGIIVSINDQNYKVIDGKVMGLKIKDDKEDQFEQDIKQSVNEAMREAQEARDAFQDMSITQSLTVNNQGRVQIKPFTTLEKIAIAVMGREKMEARQLARMKKQLRKSAEKTARITAEEVKNMSVDIADDNEER